MTPNANRHSQTGVIQRCSHRRHSSRREGPGPLTTVNSASMIMSGGATNRLYHGLESGGSHMNEASWATVLVDSWVAKAIAAPAMVAIGVIGGWWTSRANIMNAVNEQVKTLMSHYVDEINRLTTAHHNCETRLSGFESRIRQLEGELRQEKQVAASISRIGGAE